MMATIDEEIWEAVQAEGTQISVDYLHAGLGLQRAWRDFVVQAHKCYQPPDGLTHEKLAQVEALLFGDSEQTMLKPWQQEEIIKQWKRNTGTGEIAEFCETDGEQCLSMRGIYSLEELREIVRLWEAARND